MEKFTKMVSDAKIFRKTITGLIEGISKTIEVITKGIFVIQIKEAVGSYSMKDILSAKLPKLERLVIKVNLPGKSPTITLKNVQIDFKDPAKFVGNIVNKILQALNLKS